MKEKKFNLEDIPGVGPKLADKLMECGFSDPMSIAVASSGELARILEIGQATAAKIINNVRQILEMGFTYVLLWNVIKSRIKIGLVLVQVKRYKRTRTWNDAVTTLQGGEDVFSVAVFDIRD